MLYFIEMAKLYNYSQYRLYLREAYEDKKSQWKHFSHRYIAQKAGFSSGYFTKLLQGQSNLSDKHVENLAEVFGLYGEDKDFFKFMVYYDQAKTEEERHQFYLKMQEIKEKKLKILHQQETQYLSQWYHPVVREVVSCFPPESLHLAWESIYPPISESQFRDSIQLQLELGLIQEREGRYFRVDRVISTGTQLDLDAIKDYLSEGVEHARKALYELPREERGLSNVVVSVNSDGAQAIQQKLNICRKEILDIASQNRGVDQVMQVNLQWLPRYR